MGIWVDTGQGQAKKREQQPRMMKKPSPDKYEANKNATAMNQSRNEMAISQPQQETWAARRSEVHGGLESLDASLSRSAQGR